MRTQEQYYRDTLMGEEIECGCRIHHLELCSILRRRHPEWPDLEVHNRAVLTFTAPHTEQ
jgi:hypothetical protein